LKLQTNPQEEVAKDIGKRIELLPGIDKTNVIFTLIQKPMHGNLTGINEINQTISQGNLEYRPNKDFVGSDFFIFGVKADNTSLQGTQFINISVPKPNPLLPLDANGRIIFSSIIALIIVFVIFYIAKYIIEKKKLYSGDIRRIRFTDIIRGQDMDPSLSIFQFLLWTGVVIFAFTAVYFIRILGGVYYPPEHGIPEFLLVLMGISTGVPIVSNIISAYKYTPKQVEFHKEPPPPTESDQEVVGGNTNLKSSMIKPLPKFAEMLNEYGKPSLGRFQMFAWTWISIIIYLFVFYSTVVSTANSPSTLALPDIDPTLVVLMGLSQFAFLGSKAGTSEMEITKIFPSKGTIIRDFKGLAVGDLFSIYGNNFGNEGQIIWIGTKQISKDNIVYWSNDRIDIKLPDYITPGEYEIIVAKGGSWIKANEKLIVIEKQQPSGNSPKANDQEISTDQNKSVEITLTGAYQDKASKLTFSKSSEPSNGKADIVDTSIGKVTYTPNPGYSGSDSFQFKVNDGKLDSNIATVKITVNKVS
jgi:hypothetical protein